MRVFEVTIQDIQYPKLTLIINRPGFQPVVETAHITQAMTKFEVHLRNALQSEVNQITQQRKGGG